MIHLTSHEIGELKQCMRELESALATLDANGAGIAAIHVNAAIDQLKKNLNAVIPEIGLDDASIFFPKDNA